MPSKAIRGLMITVDDVRMLRAIKKKRRLTCRDYNWWDLISMMRKGLIHKVETEKGAGWPHFVISRRGRAIIKRINEQANTNNRNGN